MTTAAQRANGHAAEGRILSVMAKQMRTNLQAARKAKGMTQQAMAERLGISLRYYQQIESGDRTGDFQIWDDLEDITETHQRILRAINPGKADNR